jgi:hypothetical protein
MPKHNSGRKDGQNKTKKKRQAQGKRQHVNKYAWGSKAAAEAAKLVSTGASELNKRRCPYCQGMVSESKWHNHPCHQSYTCTCGAHLLEGQRRDHRCPSRHSG